MDNQRYLVSVTLKDLEDRGLVSNIGIMVFVRRDDSLDPLEVGDRRGFIAKEPPAHVVVDPYNMEPLLREVGDRLGANKASRTRYKCDAHSSLLPGSGLGFPRASKLQCRSTFCLFRILICSLVAHPIT